MVPWAHFLNLTKCFFYNFCCIVMMVWHNDMWVVVPSGCSGFSGPWSALESIIFKSHKVLGRVDGLSQEHLELHGVSYCTIGALVIKMSVERNIPLGDLPSKNILHVRKLCCMNKIEDPKSGKWSVLMNYFAIFMVYNIFPSHEAVTSCYYTCPYIF